MRVKPFLLRMGGAPGYWVGPAFVPCCNPVEGNVRAPMARKRKPLLVLDLRCFRVLDVTQVRGRFARPAAFCPVFMRHTAAHRPNGFSIVQTSEYEMF
jgi:hypothetical protein